MAEAMKYFTIEITHKNNESNKMTRMLINIIFYLL